MIGDTPTVHRRRWPCMPGIVKASDKVLQKFNRTVTSRLAKSVTIIGITKEPLELAAMKGRSAIPHVLISCACRTPRNATFGIKLKVPNAVEFFRTGLEIAEAMQHDMESK